MTLVCSCVDVRHAVVVQIELGLISDFTILQTVKCVQHNPARHGGVILVGLRLSFGDVALLTARPKCTLLLLSGSGDRWDALRAE